METKFALWSQVARGEFAYSGHSSPLMDTFFSVPEMKMYSLAVTPNGHLEGKGSMPPPIIMRTAATPMPTPKCSPHMDSVHPFVDSRRGSNVSLDPLNFDQKSLVFSKD